MDVSEEIRERILDQEAKEDFAGFVLEPTEVAPEQYINSKGFV